MGKLVGFVHPDRSTDADDELLSSVPEDVVDALEADMVVEDVGRPVEVFAMTDEAPEEFEGRLQMGRRVVLVPQSADGTPRSHHDVSSSETDALDRHSQSTAPAHEPLGEEAALSDTETIGGISDVSMGGGTISEVEPDPAVEEAPMCPAFGEALRWLDIVDLTSIFRRRPCVMRSPPRFLTGGYRAAMRLALQEIAHGVERNDEISQCRGWKLFLLLPRLLLCRPPRGGSITKQQLVDRFSAFSRGEWDQLLFQSEEWGAAACKGFQRRRRAQTDTPERRAETAESLVLMGEVSAGRHALEGAPLAPGTQRTLDQLRDPVRLPTVPHAPLPQPILHHQAERPFALDKTFFLKNLKRARRGAAAGPSGSPQNT